MEYSFKSDVFFVEICPLDYRRFLYRSKRIRLDRKAAIVCAVTGEHRADAILTNLSQYGLCLQTPSPLQRDEQVCVRLYRWRGYRSPRSHWMIELPGTVAWSLAGDAVGELRFGIEFDAATVASRSSVPDSPFPVFYAGCRKSAPPAQVTKPESVTPLPEG